MNPWPILIIALIGLAVFVWYHDKQQESPGSRTSAGINNKEQLVRSLDALADFFSRNEQFKWAGELQAIKTHLENPKTESEGLAHLSNLFGGMGSINDLSYEKAEIDLEASRLLDAVFRDMKLYHGTNEDRVEWMKLEEKHKDELPPRIKHAFRAE